MPKINDRFSVKYDTACWVLTESIQSINKKTGGSTIQSKRRFYPRLEQALGQIIDLSPADAEDVVGIINAIEIAEKSILNAINRRRPKKL